MQENINLINRLAALIKQQLDLAFYHGKSESLEWIGKFILMNPNFLLLDFLYNYRGESPDASDCV